MPVIREHAESRPRPPWTTVAAGGSARPDIPVRRRRVIVQVIVGAVIVIVAVGLVGVVAARRLAEAEAVNDAAKTADLLADPWCNRSSPTVW